jgi:hypothetical protein
MLDKEARGQLALLWSFCLKQTTPIAVLLGLLVPQDLVRCFGRQRSFFLNSREAIGLPVFFNETTHEGDYR